MISVCDNIINRFDIYITVKEWKILTYNKKITYLLSCFYVIKYYYGKFPKQAVMIMNPKIINENTDELFKAILTLKNIDECYAFFDDLCTVPEIKAMAQRYAVAKMLNDGEIYSKIVDKTGASTATISRVNRALTYGSDGYVLTINRVKNGGET